MGASWQTDDQKAFFEQHLASYTRNLDEGTLKGFWPTIADEWFKRWPVGIAPPELVTKKGSVAKAENVLRTKMMEKVKRAFKSKGIDHAVRIHRNLHLEDRGPRMKTEVQMYMILYYDTRIRETVVKRWEKDRVECMESRVEVNIPESEIDPEDSFLMKDPKIPISYKNAIAQKLYDAESEVIKAEVRLQREARHTNGRTVRTENDGERLALVREYHKNIPSLSHNVMDVLRNAERKCSAKGITWLACPSPSKDGKPVAYFQSVGMTPNGEDFEKFIGHEKAEEFKALFSSWIHKIYPASDWHLYSLKRSATSTDDVSPTASSSQQVNGEEGSSSAGSEGVDPDTDAQKLDLAPASVTSPTPLVTGADHLQPTTLPGANPAAIAPSDSHPNSSYPASPTGVSTTIVQGQDILDPSPPDSPDHHTPPNDVTDHHAPPNDVNPPATLDGLPMNARQSEWMISKKTLKYFREVNEAGKLSNLILHWYQLEQALGFQEITAKEFPTQKRPVVLRVFFKHGHKYKRDYELEAGSFGAEVMNWWEALMVVPIV